MTEMNRVLSPEKDLVELSKYLQCQITGDHIFQTEISQDLLFYSI